MTDKKEELGPTNEGRRLIKNLMHSQNEFTKAERVLNSCKIELNYQESEIIKWFVPKDAKSGDIYCLAVGKVWLQVHCRAESSSILKYKVSWKPHAPEVNDLV